MKLRQAKKIVNSRRVNRYRKSTQNRAAKRMLKNFSIPYQLAIAIAKPMPLMWLVPAIKEVF